MQPAESARVNGFLFADLRGYTQFVERHGDRAATELLQRYRTLVREVIARHRGAEIRTEGDSFYVVFPSASAAVQAGVAIAEAAAASDPRIEVGVGVHAGETSDTPEGPVGSAVIVAARLCSVAAAGEVLVSDTVRGLTRTSLTVRFVPRGRRRLKGMEEPITAYAVASAEGPMPRRRSGRVVPRGVLAAAATVVVAVVVGVAAMASGMLDNADGHPPGSPAGDAGGGGEPTSEQEDLLSAIPDAIAVHCAPDDAERPTGVVATLSCDLTPAALAADHVRFDRYATAAAMQTSFVNEVERVQTARGDCEMVPRGHGSWSVGIVVGGDVLCYQRDGTSWIVWTYDELRIMALARRAGDDAPDIEALREWWIDVRRFVH